MCGVKKEPTDLRLDTSKQTLHDVRARPKVTTTHSENNLTVFANGHHRPCHRNNNTAHVSGAPYKIPRPHTLHGQAEFAQFTGLSFSQPEAAPQRSMDTLSMSNQDYYKMLGSTPRGDGLPLTPTNGSVDMSNFQDSIYSSQAPTIASETRSPTDCNLTDAMGAVNWPWTASLASVSNFGYGSISTSPSQDCLTNFDEWAIPSAGLAHPTWSATDLPLDTNNIDEAYVQPISHSGESKQSAPELSTSSSPSELGEPVLLDNHDFRAPPSTASESLFWEDSPPVYRPAEIRPPTSAPQSLIGDQSNLELDMSKSLNPVPLTSTTDVNAYAGATAIAMPNTMDDEVSSSEPWLINGDNFGFDSYGVNPAYPSSWV